MALSSRQMRSGKLPAAKIGVKATFARAGGVGQSRKHQVLRLPSTAWSAAGACCIGLAINDCPASCARTKPELPGVTDPGYDFEPRLLSTTAAAIAAVFAAATIR